MYRKKNFNIQGHLTFQIYSPLALNEPLHNCLSAFQKYKKKKINKKTQFRQFFLILKI